MLQFYEIELNSMLLDDDDDNKNNRLLHGMNDVWNLSCNIIIHYWSLVMMKHK